MYKIRKTDEAAREAAKKRWSLIAKPLGSLGIFEDIVSGIAAVQGTDKIDISKRCVVVMCADNGVVSEGISQTDSSVTAIVAENITKGKASVCIIARGADTDVIPVDIGMAADVNGEIINRKISYGTNNLLHEEAMTYKQAKRALDTGIECVRELCKKGYKLIVTGEMGIGNTTTSSAVICSLLSKEARKVAGRGAGLSDAGLSRKIEVIDQAIELHKPDRNDALDVISKVGGYDIAAMAGMFIGGAIYGVPVVIDGFISSAAALCAYHMCHGCRDFMIASHVSNEGCAAEILDILGKKAPINAGMFPGEGAGGVMLIPLLDAAVRVYNGMVLFEDVNIKKYEDYR